MEAKLWRKPKLVVLFRGRPEEAVLQACKVVDNITNGPPNLRNCRASVYQGGSYGWQNCSVLSGT